MYTTPSIHDPITCSAAPLHNVVSTPTRTNTASILHHTTVAAGNYR